MGAVGVSFAASGGTLVPVVPTGIGLAVGGEPLHTQSLRDALLGNAIEIVHPHRRAIVLEKEVRFDPTCVEREAFECGAIGLCRVEIIVRSIRCIEMLRQGFQKEDQGR